jgi:hypothetical protein
LNIYKLHEICIGINGKFKYFFQVNYFGATEFQMQQKKNAPQVLISPNIYATSVVGKSCTIFNTWIFLTISWFYFILCLTPKKQGKNNVLGSISENCLHGDNIKKKLISTFKIKLHLACEGISKHERGRQKAKLQLKIRFRPSMLQTKLFLNQAKTRAKGLLNVQLIIWMSPSEKSYFSD